MLAGGSITVRLTSMFTSLVSATNKEQISLHGLIQTGKAGGQLYIDYSPYQRSLLCSVKSSTA